MATSNHAHKHSFNNLTATLNGMAGNKCGCKWDMPSGFPTFLQALKKHIDDEVDARIEGMTDALGLLGLNQCEQCEKWFKDGTAQGLAGRFGACCAECIPEWYEFWDETHETDECSPVEKTIAHWYCTHETALAKVRGTYRIPKLFAKEIQQLRRRA